MSVWQPLTDEQASKLDVLQGTQSPDFSGFYEENPITWKLLAICAGIGLVGSLLLLLFDSHTQEKDALMVVIMAINFAYASYIIWRNERHALLDDGVARLTNQNAELLPWTEIESIKRNIWLWGPNASVKVRLKDGDKVKLPNTKVWLERLMNHPSAPGA